MPIAGPQSWSDPRGWGSAIERRRADALADRGYVALAFDLHGGRYVGDPEQMLARCSDAGPQHAQRAWRDIVDPLVECVPVTE